MGGFAFDSVNPPAKSLPNAVTRLTARLDGLRYIANYAPDLIPYIFGGGIRDESKANGLAKILLYFQAVWFCVQYIVKVAQGQDITLLKINTSAYALCALLRYTFTPYHSECFSSPLSMLSRLLPHRRLWPSFNVMPRSMRREEILAEIETSYESTTV